MARPFAFFALTFLLSIPFWIIGVTAPRYLMPGLPVAGLAVLAPLASAAILTYHETGGAGVTALLARPLDCRRIRPLWYPRRCAFAAAIIIGVVWAGWHVVALVQAHRPPAWIAWWAVGTVASRVLIVWLYTSTGRSVAAASLYHAMSNLSWQLFPNRGSHFDPQVNALLLVLAATIVTIMWKPRILRG